MIATVYSSYAVHSTVVCLPGRYYTRVVLPVDHQHIKVYSFRPGAPMFYSILEKEMINIFYILDSERKNKPINTVASKWIEEK